MRQYANLAVVMILTTLVRADFGPMCRGSSLPMSVDQDDSTTRSGQQDAGSSDLIEPLGVRFRLADGVRVTGDLTEWDDEGIDGSFGQRDWIEIHYEDIWRLFRRVMDENSAEDWLDAGRALLLASLDQPRAKRLADNALRRAVRLDESVSGAIEQIRAELVEIKGKRERAKIAAEAERLAAISPEATPWRPDPWPVLDETDQEAAVLTMRSDAASILDRVGLQLIPVETDYFLFYSDLPRKESAKWANQLDKMYHSLAMRFSLPKDKNIFWGKAVIFVFSNRAMFRKVESEAFGYAPPKWADGLSHPLGPKVFVNFYRQRQDETFAAVLVHETAHGFMHRYRTPRRLPTWANEGVADFLASVLFFNSPVDQDRRRKGLTYIRRGGNVNPILDYSYADDSWPGPNRIGYSIGYLLIELMIRDRPERFAKWVDAVKDGKHWELALEEEFGVTRQVLVERFIKWYRVND